MHRMKNPMHDRDREKAQSIAANIKFNYLTYIKNPYFNKKPLKDPEI